MCRVIDSTCPAVDSGHPRPSPLQQFQPLHRLPLLYPPYMVAAALIACGFEPEGVDEDGFDEFVAAGVGGEGDP